MGVCRRPRRWPGGRLPPSHPPARLLKRQPAWGAELSERPAPPTAYCLSCVVTDEGNLVAVRISDIGAVEAFSILRASTWRTFIFATVLQGKGMKPIDNFDFVAKKRRYDAIAYSCRLAINAKSRS